MTKKQNTYITFGFEHVHKIKDVFFDKDTVALIENVTPAEGREKAFELFGNKFCFEYPEKHFPFDSLKLYYKKGVRRVPNLK